MSTIAPAPEAAPVSPAPKKSRKWLWITGIVVASVVGISIGSASAGSKAPVQAAAPPAVTVTAAAPPAVTVTAAAPPAVTVTAEAAAPVTLPAPPAATVTAKPAAPVVGPGGAAVGTGLPFTQSGVNDGTGTATVWTAQWTQTNPSSYDTSPPTNGAFLIVDVSVLVATGTATSNPYDWTLKDAAGHSYTVGYSGSQEPALHDSGTLAAGDTARGFLTFDVPQGPMTLSMGTGLKWEIPAS